MRMHPSSIRAHGSTMRAHLEHKLGQKSYFYVFNHFSHVI